MDSQTVKILKNKGIDDEICSCGHSKGWHNAHNLDVHGGECELCSCPIYEFELFVSFSKWKK